MLRSLKSFFDSLLPPADSAAPLDAHRLHLATAVLLVEVMRADSTCTAAERQSVLAVLRQRFALNDQEVALLLEAAEHGAQHATDFHTFTSALNDALDTEQKVQVVEAMWQVACADGTLGAHEQHVLWRVADLLHVPHGAYIHAKLRAKAAAGMA